MRDDPGAAEADVKGGIAMSEKTYFSLSRYFGIGILESIDHDDDTFPESQISWIRDIIG